MSFLKKYKPNKYNDFIIDKEYINLLNTLQNMDNLNILFIGEQGVGKTSLIMATIYEYYNTTNISKYDVLFINSLKEQGINYYRNNLRTFCQTKCSNPLKKKFIILDDIDYINEQSQQVFRNCMDKYSHNVHFIISCTNIQKVIDNIQSRTIIIQLNKISLKLLKKFSNVIEKKENIIINDDAKQFLFNICENSFQKLLIFLQKFKLFNKKITLNYAKELCCNINYLELQNYTNAWYNDKDYKKAMYIIFKIYNKGYSVLDILDNYFSFIKITDILNEEQKYIIIKFICKYIAIFYKIHEHKIELAFFTNNLIKKIL
jgi:DNA polymerase III delta prime subunit